MDKAVIERCCRNAGMTPERRKTLQGYEVFVADGFCEAPNVDLWYGKMGVKPGEFPFGVFCTIWWSAMSDDKFDVGQPLFFDAFHNPEYDAKTKKMARVNTALAEANAFLLRRKRIKLNG